MRLTACIAGFLLLTTFAQAKSLRTDDEVLAQAETAFRQGIDNKARLLQARKQFAEATDAYLILHRRGLRSPALYRNLGNAAVLADRWPTAIWAYHVGLRLDPNDNIMREHLAFVRGKVIYSPKGQGRPDADTWPAWLHRPTEFELSCVGALAYVLAWIAGTCAVLSRKSPLILWTAVLILVAASAGAGWWHETEQAEFDRQSPLVVVKDNSDFYRGNAVSYPKHADLAFLPRGLEARQLHRRGNWLQVRLSTGEVGWVPAANVLIVGP